MIKLGLFSKYSNEEKKGFDFLMCYETSISGTHISRYSNRKANFFVAEDYRVILATSSIELDSIIRKYKFDVSKTLFYSHKVDPAFLKDIKRGYPTITIINARENQKLVLTIDEGFKWDNYDNVNLPKQDKNTKGNEPTTG